MQNKAFKKAGLLPNYSGGRSIYWNLDPVFDDELPYTFTVEASEDPNFSELSWSKNVGDNYYAIDDSNIVQTQPENYLYRIRLDTGSKKTYYSDKFFIDDEPVPKQRALLAYAVVRKELIRMSVAGIGGWVLKRKNYAVVATEDVDPISGVPITDNVGSFGTGYKGGYYPPLKVIFTREDFQQSVALSQSGEGVTKLQTIKARFVGFPLLGTHDVLVLTNGDRYTLTQVNNRFFPGTNITIIQNCTANIIPPTDPVYTIQVN